MAINVVSNSGITYGFKWVNKNVDDKMKEIVLYRN
jgi:hypothetical protein